MILLLRNKSGFAPQDFFRLLVVSPAVLLSLLAMGAQGGDVYTNDFNGAAGTVFPEWSSSAVTYFSEFEPPGRGTLPTPVVTNGDAPNGTRRFLGEFGGPKIGVPKDAGYNRTRVEQTVSLTLTNLPPHRTLKVSFDLYILRSWDGNSPQYGPDRWSLDVDGGPVLLAATFSNNPKVSTQGSDQDYPRPQSPPWTGAATTNTMGCKFFGDSIYPLEFSFAHSSTNLVLNFRSSLFEGKGTADEAWGLDNVRVSTADPAKAR